MRTRTLRRAIVASAILVPTGLGSAFWAGRASVHSAPFLKPALRMNVVPKPTIAPLSSIARVAMDRSAPPPPDLHPDITDTDAPVNAPKVTLGQTHPTRGFGVQLGAYPSQGDAQAFLKRHARVLKDYTIYLMPVKLRGDEVWHRIRVGRFRERRHAETLRNALPEDLGSAALVVSYR